MKNQFLRPNGVENVSNMSQPVWNIIIDDQKHILDLNKSHKGPLKKRCRRPLPSGRAAAVFLFSVFDLSLSF